MSDETRDSASTPAPPRFPRLVLGVVVFLTLSLIVIGIVLVRQSPPPTPAPALIPVNPAASPPALQSPGAPPRPADSSKPGMLGIAKTQCQGFADIAARFWDLKSEGRPLEFTYEVIDKNSAGDMQKQRVLKALAQLVYRNEKLGRDAAYRNAFEACLKQ